MQFNQITKSIDNALLDKARLLFSPALRERLEQGREEPFIMRLLDAKTAKDLADVLCMELDAPDSAGKVALLNRYLKRIVVIKVSLNDFHPNRRTLERGDVDELVEEFAIFISGMFGEADGDNLPILEIDY